MFFGKQPERKFPHAVTRCVLFKGTTKVYIIDDKTCGGPLDVYKRQVYRFFCIAVNLDKIR